MLHQPLRAAVESRDRDWGPRPRVHLCLPQHHFHSFLLVASSVVSCSLKCSFTYISQLSPVFYSSSPACGPATLRLGPKITIRSNSQHIPLPQYNSARPLAAALTHLLSAFALRPSLGKCSFTTRAPLLEQHASSLPAPALVQVINISSCMERTYSETLEVLVLVLVLGQRG